MQNATVITTQRPHFIPNYPELAKWYSTDAAYVYMALTIVLLLCMLRNLIWKAKTYHTRLTYVYLVIWCVCRIPCFAMRAYALTDDHGQTFSTYQWAQIVASVGFMPLAEVIAFCTLEGSALALGYSAKTHKILDLLIKFLFVTFGTLVTAYVIDFTLNKPFGSNAKDYAGDLAMREIGFNGLILITAYGLIFSIRNYIEAVKSSKIPAQFVFRFRLMMGVITVNSLLMLVKLIYNTYRNWNPSELKDEHIWYILSISPEFLFVLFYVDFGFLKVFDDIEKYELEEQERSAKIMDEEVATSVNSIAKEPEYLEEEVEIVVVETVATSTDTKNNSVTE